MTEEASGAQAAPVTTVLSTDFAPVLERLRVAEDTIKILLASVNENIHPRLQTIEEALGRLAQSAEQGVSASVTEALAELHQAVASLAGASLGLPGHDSGRFLHEWWAKIEGVFRPAASGRSPQIPGQTSTQGAGGGSVTNSGGPVEIPLQPSPK